MVGRARELRLLTDALAHPPALVLIEGEAGIGKTRLLREALAGGAGATVLSATCPPFREPLTLGVLVDALRAACADIGALALSPLGGALRPLFPEWSEVLPPAPEPLAEPAAARHRLMRALAELLDRLGTDVLIVEDVHWADEAIQEFLVYLAVREPRRISLVLTYRPEDLPPDSLVLRLSSRRPSRGERLVLTLAGLDVEDTGALVSSMLGSDPVSSAFATFLHERTEGVPLAVEESIRLLHDRTDLIRRQGEWVRRGLRDIAVPGTIRDAVRERASRLAGPARSLLLAAAVVAEPADPAILAEVCRLPPDPLADALRSALRSGLLAEDDLGRIAFRHVLAARTVYDSAFGPDRRDAHERAGSALERAWPQPIARLAHHFRAAGDTARWSHYAELAADQALGSGDHQTAAAVFHELLDTGAVRGAGVARISQKMPAYNGNARRPDVVRALRTALRDDSLDAAAQAEIRGQLGRTLMQVGEYAAGAAELHRALPGLDGNPLATAQAMLTLGAPRRTSWPVAQHLWWLDRAATTTLAVGSGEERRRLTVERAAILLDLGDTSGWAGVADLPDPDSVAAAVWRAGVSLNVGDAAMRWGRYDEARRRLFDAQSLAERHDQRRLRDMSLVTSAHLDWFTGRWHHLTDRLDTLATVVDEPMVQLDADLIRGLLASAHGDVPLATASVRRVVDECTRRGILDLLVESSAALTRLLLADGHVLAALAVSDEPVRIVADKQLWLWSTEILPARTSALLAGGRQRAAEELVARFADGLSGAVLPAAGAALLECHALLADAGGDTGAAARAWGEAAGAWQALPRPYDALLACQRRAAVLLAGGERGTVPGQLADVSRSLRALGATAQARAADDVLDRYGLGARRPGRPGYGDALSPRESDVVELLLTGLTNRQIAERLSRSPKTIAAQLRSAMRKYCVTSRTALAVAVAQGREAGQG